MSAATTRVSRSARLAALGLVALAALVTSAHIGDNNTHYRGPAGPYTVQVVIRHPGVVPGLADITVRVEGAGVTRVAVRPVPWNLGLEGSPRPDEARPIPGAPGLFAAELWFMTRGSYSVHVDVEGSAGSGTAVVPVASIATETLAMSNTLGAVLIVLGLLLGIGLITIVRAAIGESVLPPGEQPDARRRRRARIATAGATIGIALALLGGRSWWAAEAAAYNAGLHEPLAIETAVYAADGSAMLEIALVDPAWLGRRWTPLVPDHGKLMHAFLVREPALDVFAHVHPEPVDRDTFRVALPPLPPGTYTLYADVVHESGFAQTLTRAVEIGTVLPAAAYPASAPDADDSWWQGQPSGTRVVLDDGTTVDWAKPARLVRGELVDLSFTVTGAAGAGARLEPYMGMLAHAAVRRADGAVFVHLHPTGSISMAAQELLARLHLGDDGAIDHAAHAAAESGTNTHDAHAAHAAHRPIAETITIPYAFPRPGRYRVWLQFKRDGRVETVAFDAAVLPAR